MIFEEVFMRVLCMRDGKRSLEVMEIVDIGFDDDITAIKDTDGNYGNFLEKPIHGLYLRDMEGELFYIKDVSLETCNEICKAIVQSGYYDLSGYIYKTLDKIYEEDCEETFIAKKGDILPYSVSYFKRL